MIKRTKARIAVAFFAASAPLIPSKVKALTMAGIERATPAKEQDAIEA